MKCVDCFCAPELCNKIKHDDCKICIKDDCCCSEIHLKEQRKSIIFFGNVRNLYASALGIEILCILSAEIGQNSSFFLFGFQSPFAIMMSYIMGYSLAGFTTFATILGRYNMNRVMDGCCSAIGCEEASFVGNIKLSFRNAWEGIKRMPQLYKKPYFRQILKTSLFVLITGESVCILTAETVNLVFFRHALWLSIPLSLLAGALALTMVEAYKKTKRN